MKNLFFGKRIISGLVSDKEKNGSAFPLIFTSTNQPMYGNFVAGGPSGFFKLEMYSGQPFVDVDETHKLISFVVNPWNSDPSRSGFSYSIDDDGLIITIGISNIATKATNNGRCTWFKFYSPYSNVAVMGTVGRIGSDADMIITDDIIIEGEAYKSFGFKMFISSKIKIIGV